MLFFPKFGSSIAFEWKFPSSKVRTAVQHVLCEPNVQVPKPQAAGLVMSLLFYIVLYTTNVYILYIVFT